MDFDTPLQVIQVDAFTDTPFKGNPAAVMVLDRFLPDEHLRALAAEHNLSETAFLVRECDSCDWDYQLRWFTPTTEVTLCGHATLAAAHALYQHYGWTLPSVRFNTRYAGVLTVAYSAPIYSMDFPARPIVGSVVSADVNEAIGTLGLPVCQSEEDWLVELPTEAAVRGLQPDFAAIAKLNCRGLIITAKADPDRAYAVASRFFCPNVGINEDPVTGSAHCVVAPYWAERLSMNAFTCYQASQRGGLIDVSFAADRVRLGGQAVTYSVATLWDATRASLTGMNG